MGETNNTGRLQFDYQQWNFPKMAFLDNHFFLFSLSPFPSQKILVLLMDFNEDILSLSGND